MKPLGIPEGSVRALIALIALGSAAFMWITARAMTQFQETIVTVAVTYYFAYRSAQSPAPSDLPPAEPLRDLLAEAKDKP